MWNEACAWAVVPLPHEKLIAWQRADDLFIELHRVATCLFPPEERFELAAQLRRGGLFSRREHRRGYGPTVST